MVKDVCPVCQMKLVSGCRSWHFFCKNCGYEKANLQPTINLHSAHKTIDENARETGLRELRKTNFQLLLNYINALRPNGGRLLEVGCAHGWFLSFAKKDFEVLGIEPDNKFINALTSQDIPVRNGYFPDVIQKNEKFDVIVFNDVFEHIPDIYNIILCCHQCLNKDGLLVINLPNSNGIFYKLSKSLCRLNNFILFDRMWQKNFPSPHLHYFHLDNLNNFLRNNKFDPTIEGNLPTLRLNGLYSRIAYTGNFGTVLSILMYITIVLFLPLLRILPKDIIYVVVKRA